MDFKARNRLSRPLVIAVLGGVLGLLALVAALRLSALVPAIIASAAILICVAACAFLLAARVLRTEPIQSGPDDPPRNPVTEGTAGAEQVGLAQAQDSLSTELSQVREKLEAERRSSVELSAELTKAKADYRALLKAIPDLIFRVRSDGTVLDYRGSREASLYASPEEFLGRKLSDVLPPEVAGPCLALFPRVIETGNIEACEYQLAVERGLRDFEARIMRDGPDSVVSIVRDVTSRKESERKLVSAETELRNVISCVSDFLWCADFDAFGNRTPRFLSPVVESVTGRPQAFFVEKGKEAWAECLHPDDKARMLAVFNELITGEPRRHENEYRIVTPDGSVRWLRESITTNTLDTGARRFYGVVSNITESKLRDEALRQTREALDAVIRTAPLAIYTLDLHGHVRSWNSGAERIFGWTEAEVVGKRLPFVPEDELEDFYARLEKSRKGEMLTGLEVCRLRKDGSQVHISLWSAVLRGESGEINGFMNVATDVTGKKALEAQLRQSQKMEAVGRLAGGVAHDFNNLLTVMTCCGQMLLEDVPSEGASRTSVEELLKAVSRAADLTNQLLAFSRKQIAQRKVIDLNAVVVNMDKMLRRVIGEHIELSTLLAPNLAMINADPGQIEQVIMNLVVNSRDAMPQGGKIRIGTGNVSLDADERRRSDIDPGSYVVLSISDNGQGMDAETKSHLFEPFFTTKGTGKGTGLGLSTVYGIVKQNGGEIEIYTELGKGTLAQIYLPAVPSASEQVSIALPESQPQAGTETVLLVEDEQDVRKLVRLILERSGYKVLEASRPSQALKLSSELGDGLHLLLTDVVMPEMSGRELALRLCTARPSLRVLFMSGHTEDAVLRAVFGNPDVAFIKKPFTPQSLTRKVREVLDGPQKPFSEVVAAGPPDPRQSGPTV